jgi:hypothetical protein
MHRTLKDPPTATEIAILKKRLLKKGAEINEKLTALLANPTLRIDELLGGGKPGETPIERLQRFMALIDGRLRAIREGRYGICEKCGDGLPFAHLEQIPWIDTCTTCAGAEE